MRVLVFLNAFGERRLVGALSDDDGIAFQYAPEFLKSRIELSPLAVPRTAGLWRGRHDLFGGLPGFVADSLPDGWGNLLLDRRLRALGRHLSDVSPLERLCWVGSHGMGALEFEPEQPVEAFEPEAIQLDALGWDIDAVLEDAASAAQLDRLKLLAGSSGGARPKILCLVSEDRSRIQRMGECRGGFAPWIIKFRSSSDNSDQGVIEYAASLAAREAGITMPATHLFPSETCAGWFGIERFDRKGDAKLHMATAAGLLHCDFRLPCLDYETVLALTHRLAGRKAVVQQFRRCVFNILIGNRDDHAKNFSFVMAEPGRWSVSPAYDLVPETGSSPEHMTSVLGKGRNISRSDLMHLAGKFQIPEASARDIIGQAEQAANLLPKLCSELGARVKVRIERLG
jgi:serine/threonine-protein kinase HipA